MLQRETSGYKYVIKGGEYPPTPLGPESMSLAYWPVKWRLNTFTIRTEIFQILAYILHGSNKNREEYLPALR